MLHVIQRFGLARAVPLGATATFDMIAEQSGLSSAQARRILRYAMTNHVFEELQPGIVARPALSRALVEDVGVSAEACQLTDERFPAAAHVGECISTTEPSCIACTNSIDGRGH